MGILLSRTLSGASGDAFGWRVVFWSASVLMWVVTAVLYFTVPTIRPQNAQVKYPIFVGNNAILYNPFDFWFNISSVVVFYVASFVQIPIVTTELLYWSNDLWFFSITLGDFNVPVE